MKKKWLFVCAIFSLALCLCVVFCSCQKTDNQTDQTVLSEQRKIYNMYVEYATAMGEDVLTYEQWLDSIRGADGIDGQNGKSAYDIWKENGHSGTESDFLDWLKGAKGDDGAQGPIGPQGVQGPAGQDGDDGAAGKDGANGKDGSMWFTGNGDPQNNEPAQAKQGDLYLDTSNGNVYQKQADGSWQQIANLTGPKGEQGQQGQQGDKGQDGSDGQNGQDGQNGTDGKDGKDGLSAYDIFKKYYPFYQGDEEQWIADLVNGNLTIYKVTFKSEVAEDIVRYVFVGQDLTDIPEVPEKEGQESAKWDRDDFTNITADIEVHAVYTMQQFTVTFHNPFREEEDVTRTVSYGEELTDIPTITPIEDNDAYWDVTDFSRITENMTVNAVYETQGLQYTAINSQQEYRVSADTMSHYVDELFIPAYHDGKPVTVIAEKGFAGDYSSYFLFKFAHLPETIIEIRTSAFSYCSSLQSIIIPSKVTVIADSAFV